MTITFFKTMLTAGVLSAFTLSFSACNSDNTDSAQQGEESAMQDNHEGMDHGHTAAEAAVVQVPDYSAVDESFKKSVNALYDEYLQVKDGLFAGNVASVQEAAQGISGQVGKADASKLSAEQKAFFDKHAGMVKSHASAIAGAGDLEAQRTQLDMLSSSMFALVKAFGANDEEAFYQYCPMANNNKGAFWISQQKEIQNPYMGKKMPTCGENKEILN